MTVAELITILIDAATRGDCDLSSEVAIFVEDEEWNEIGGINVDVDKIEFETEGDGDVLVHIVGEESISETGGE